MPVLTDEESKNMSTYLEYKDRLIHITGDKFATTILGDRTFETLADAQAFIDGISEMYQNMNATMRHEHVSFGVKDLRGRVIGARITRSDTGVNGPHLVLRVHATRNGQDYGAMQRMQYFATESERETAIMTYLESARKRNVKKAKVPA